MQVMFGFLDLLDVCVLFPIAKQNTPDFIPTISSFCKTNNSPQQKKELHCARSLSRRRLVGACMDPKRLVHELAKLLVVNFPVVVHVGIFDDGRNLITGKLPLPQQVQHVFQFRTGDEAVVIYIVDLSARRLGEKRARSEINAPKDAIQTKKTPALTSKAAFKSALVSSPLRNRKEISSSMADK